MKKKSLTVVYHIPSLHTVYAGRTIYFGYKHAFEDLGHTFVTVTAEDNFGEILDSVKPDLFMMGLNVYNLKFIDLEKLKKVKTKGTKVIVNIPMWKNPFLQKRVNETLGLENSKDLLRFIRNGLGDIYYNVCEQDDERMDGFSKSTGYSFHTIPLACDKVINFPEYTDDFKADISFVGTYLPEKRAYFQKYVFPLRSKYILKLYGQDWTTFDRGITFVQKVGQYYNVPLLRSIRKPSLAIEDERRIYSSSGISINVHEEYQRLYGGDCNERTFKIPACGGFEITDDVACIRKYFKDNEEIVVAKNEKEWFEKIDYYMKHPEKRKKIIEAGKKRVHAEHTYHNRVKQMISIYSSLA